MKKKIIYSVIVMLLIMASVYLLWLRQGRSLNTEFIPTAEFLAHNPIEFPAFIGDISPDPGTTLFSGQEMCLEMYPGELMKSGDSYQELEELTAKNTLFYINNQPLPFYTYVYVSYPAGLREVIEGQETGSTLFCFVPQLENGIHIADLKTKDLSGTEYSYKWAFAVR